MHLDPAAFDAPAIDRTLRNARQQLLTMRGAHGHWEGELSSSPLSTATAVLALAIVDRSRGSAMTTGPHQEAIRRGLQWLIAQQNADGGWGDTSQSLSNISTTALAWATLVALAVPADSPARARAEAWLSAAAGSLAPERLTHAIAGRYGKDRTFSVPILTVLALAGCLGEEGKAWCLVPQLPYELAACPHAWFKWLRLPVVSYALPALIALGRLRHVRRPSLNPLARTVRRLAQARAMNVLEEIQPESGGFLEATPLTSFVVMSLASSGETSHAVVNRGAKFLVESQRADGSWPIDTNLATWVTTLSINALAADGRKRADLPPHERRLVLTWLLDQQYHEEHPYTHAAPGGWAWTDLSGGVPDADDTSGALLAIHGLAAGDARAESAAAAGIGWLLDLQNRDGGMPTFCRGWGALPFDRSSADLTAHALRALAAWLPVLPPGLRGRAAESMRRMRRYLVRAQRADGAWAPLWFGNQHAPGEENLTYGTSRVLQAAATGNMAADEAAWRRALGAGCRWLLSAQNSDGGWGGGPGTPSSIEETAQAVEALASLWPQATGRAADGGRERCSAILAETGPQQVQAALVAGASWLCDATDGGTRFPPSPIGFYFAKLWYFEELYPLIFTVAALGRVQQALAVAAEVSSSPAVARVQPEVSPSPAPADA